MKGVCLLTVWMGIGLMAASAQTPALSDKADAFGAAARKGDVAAVTKLLDEGVDVNTKFRYGVTALFFAADHGHVEVVKVLLARGADVNVKDTFYGATPLTWASSPAQKRKPEHPEIVRLLLKHGAQGKEAALMSAVMGRDAATTKVILEHGGLPEKTLSNALDAATKAKQTELIALLEAAGAKPLPELKMDEAQLARYAGTYRDAGGSELVIAVSAGRLTLAAGKSGAGPPQPIPLVARTETQFAGAEAVSLAVTFRIEDGKVTALTIGPAASGATYTRVGGEK